MLRHLILSLVLLSLLAGCKSAPPEGQAGTRPDSTRTKAANEVSLSDAEAQMAGLETDTLSHRVLSGGIKVNGVLDVPPEQLISIDAPLGGIVEQTSLLQGAHVHKGDVLAVIRNLAFIQLQEEYMQTQGRLRFAKADMERQRELVQDEVAPVKNLQRAEAEYASLQAQAAGQQARLRLAGLPAGKVPFATTATLRAPKDAYVKEVNVTVGQTVTPTDALFQLVDPSHIHVELTVFERDVPSLRKGQVIRFTLPNDSAAERLAHIYLISRTVDAEQRTVRIHGHPDDEEDPSMLPGMFVRAVIETSGRRAPALPEEAMVEYEGRHFVFAALSDSAGHHRFRMLEVKPGAQEGGYVEVQAPGAPLPAGTRYAVKGAYALLGKLKNVKEEE